MTFEDWWARKSNMMRRRPGTPSKEEIKLLCHEAWVLAMDHGQVDDVSVEGVAAVPIVCGSCLHASEFHLPKSDKSQSPCMNVHCGCEDFQ